MVVGVTGLFLTLLVNFLFNVNTLFNFVLVTSGVVFFVFNLYFGFFLAEYVKNPYKLKEEL